jgi:DNA-binding response OmpR family regulator
MKVMVIEDAGDIRDEVAEFLGGQGHEVATASPLR